MSDSPNWTKDNAAEPYLILHKVRGEPAFDIAIRMYVGGPEVEEVWIIPTSGHAAYPYWSTPISISRDGEVFSIFGHNEIMAEPRNWKDWPDHYACNDRPIKQDVYEVQAKAVGLLEGLGLVKKVTVERRF